jgi:hypothetical protein
MARYPVFGGSAAACGARADPNTSGRTVSSSGGWFAKWGGRLALAFLRGEKVIRFAIDALLTSTCLRA